MYGTTMVKEKIDYFSHAVESVNNYKAYTNFPFLLCEASLVARLLQEGLSWKQIKGQVIDASQESRRVGSVAPVENRILTNSLLLTACCLFVNFLEVL